MNTASLSSKIVALLPPMNILPLLFSILMDSLAVSIYWNFWGIWLDEQLANSYLILAVVLAIPGIIAVFGVSLFSAVSDKTGRRKVLMLVSRILLTVQYILLIFFQNTITNVMIIQFTFGFFTQVYYTVLNALLTIICHPDKRGQVASFNLLFASLGWMIGSGISSVIYENLGISGSLGFGAGFSLLCGIIAYLSPSKQWNHNELLMKKNLENKDGKMDSISTKEILTTEPIKNNMKQSSLHTLNSLENNFSNKKADSYWKILTRKPILKLLFVLAIVDFGIGPFNIVTQVYLKEIGLPNNYIALANSLATFFGMILLLFLGIILDRAGRKPVLLFAMFVYPFIYGLILICTNRWRGVFAFYLFPVYAIKGPTAQSIVSDLTKENERVRGMSLITLEYTIFANAGAFLACWIADQITQGLIIAPIFPIIGGAIAFILVIFIIKETNVKVLEKKELKRKLSLKS